MKGCYKFMGYLIRELPESERPRERFKEYGVESLSNEELISILIRTGTANKSVRDVSLNLLQEIGLDDLKNTSYKTLKSIKGIGEVKAMTLLSAVELGKRVFCGSSNLKRINNSLDVYNLTKGEMMDKLQEQFMVIYLDTLNNVLLKKILFIGTVNRSEIASRDIFREAVKNNATKIILVHNHPAGSVNPSNADLYLTQELVNLGKMLEIKVLDHIIIGKNNYYSIKERYGDIFAS